jgi:hypothetical protein
MTTRAGFGIQDSGIREKRVPEPDPRIVLNGRAGFGLQDSAKGHKDASLNPES